ncbi:MAG: type I-C CRISPR-associated protein Cas5c [Myxococcota bacterium]
MSFGVKLRVWGDYASFNRPEMKVERVSYDVMTPSAARGVLEAIYWKPQMRWVVDRIHVLAPIRFTSVRRNEISAKIPSSAMNNAVSGKADGVSVQEVRQQRAALVLRDVNFGIEAHVELTEQSEANPIAKHLEMFKRRARKGQCFHRPYLGCREFCASFELVDSFPTPPDELLVGPRPLGLMLHDFEFQPADDGEIIETSEGRRVRAIPHFFSAEMNNGVISVPRLPTSNGAR